MASTTARPIPRTQDLPPEGGFPSIRYKRNIPKKGPSGLTLVLGITAISAYGFYRYFQGKNERHELERENMWSRIHLVPLLQAEHDRDTYRREQAAIKREAEIMKDVPGWKPGESVYHTKRYIPTSIWVIPEKD
ncbi:12146_t:CDS:2 [Ambispora gerdemannii]|uniref:NADH dehydrogenase [ubiquinone] 1 alpha subcomplex subunit 13 n=1 Tax=Ambispora gerdemannii TaxID=144530 RepID=A0A9N8YIG8_9GLOM|nr:12146_t:CDS:2 [Ambispora gerdemannii]